MTTILGGASNSDSNSILMALLIILIVIGIAYFIYYLYMQNTLISTNNKSNGNIMEEEINNSGGRMMNNDNFKNEMSIEKFENRPRKHSNYEMKERNEMPMPIKNDSICFPKEQLTADELLPTDNSSLWAQINPSGEGSFKDKNFLQSGYHIGINTVGQTLRNANLQLRSEPPCPQVKVSPWLQATIEPDLGRKPFEIGGCA